VIDGLLVLAVVAAFAAALRSPLLDVDREIVTGAARTGRAVVAEAAGIHRGDQLMDVDAKGAGQRVAALPWVLDVTVSRGLDGLVKLSGREREPVASVAAGDTLLLVDATGRVLGPPPDGTPAGLVRLEGLEGPFSAGNQLPGAASVALGVASRLDDRLQQAVSSLSVGPEISGRLTAGGEVLLGGTDRLSAKLRSLATVLDQVDLTCLATVDLRAPGNPVLTRTQGCS
jgi:cell division protein FtsQ